MQDQQHSHATAIQRRHIAVAVLMALTLSVPLAMYIAKAPQVAATVPVASPGQGLNITTFNTEYWHDDERALAQAVDYRERDVVLLQEHLEKKGDVWGPTNRIAQLKAVLPDRHVDSEGEVVTVSKWPIVYRRGFSDGGKDGHILRTDLAIGARVVSVYNIHLPVHMHLELLAQPAAFIADVQRGVRRREWALRTMIADISANKNPVVIGGDFNSSAAMQGTAWFREHMADAYSGVHCRGPSDTFSLGRFLHWRIDYIYMSKELRPAGYCTKSLEDISDHRAVVAALAFTGAPVRLSQLQDQEQKQ